MLSPTYTFHNITQNLRDVSLLEGPSGKACPLLGKAKGKRTASEGGQGHRDVLDLEWKDSRWCGGKVTE